MKEFLSIRGIEFESINVAEDAEAMAELQRHGFRSVPVIRHGKQTIHAVDLLEVAQLLDLPYESKPELGPETLAARLNNVLDALIAVVEQIPERLLAHRLPGRERTVLSLINHVPEIVNRFRSATDGGTFSATSALAEPDVNVRPDVLLGAVIPDTKRFVASLDGDFDKPVQTYYGEQTMHQLMERTTWHCAQHVRQLTAFLAINGIKPNRELTEQELKGLPVPLAIWD